MAMIDSGRGEESRLGELPLSTPISIICILRLAP
jgi:hypothetical protein